MNSRFESFRNTYTTISQLLLNLILLFVFLNVVAYAAYKLVDKVISPNQVVEKYGSEMLRAAYPNLDEPTWKSLIEAPRCFEWVMV